MLDTTRNTQTLLWQQIGQSSTRCTAHLESEKGPKYREYVSKKVRIPIEIISPVYFLQKK